MLKSGISTDAVADSLGISAERAEQLAGVYASKNAQTSTKSSSTSTKTTTKTTSTTKEASMSKSEVERRLRQGDRSLEVLNAYKRLYGMSYSDVQQAKYDADLEAQLRMVYTRAGKDGVDRLLSTWVKNGIIDVYDRTRYLKMVGL